MWKKSLIVIFIIAALSAGAFAGYKYFSKGSEKGVEETEELDYSLLDSDEEYDESEDDDYNGISFSEEDDGYKMKIVKTTPDFFIGSWMSTSDRAVYYYGDVELKIKDDKTWTGTITGENLKGTWTFSDNKMHMKDVVLEFNFDLAFISTGKLVMIEYLEEGDELHTVLTRK